MVPGTQTRQLPHHKDPVQGNLLHEDQFDVGRQVPIELEPGGAVFFHSGVIHRSYANRSQQSRRA